MAEPDPAHKHGDTEPRLPDMSEADARNGEPGALDDEPSTATRHRTGERQAQQNRENDPPA